MQGPVPAHADGAGGQIQSTRNLLGPQGFHVTQAQDLSVSRAQMCEGLSDLFPPLGGDQARQGVFSGVLFGRAPLQPVKSLVPATLRAAPLHADVPGRLKKEGGQSLLILDSSRTKRLERPSKHFLRDVLRGVSIAKPASGKESDPVPEALGQLRGKGVGVGGLGGSGSVGRGLGRVVRIARRTIAPVTVLTGR